MAETMGERARRCARVDGRRRAGWGLTLTLGLAVLVPAGPASAAAPDTVFLEELTWPDVRDAIEAGRHR